MKIQLRRDTAANWENANPILLAGEVGIELPDKMKVGDGVKDWVSLPYTDKELSDEVRRLNTIIADEPTTVYSYRGKTPPNFPTSAKKGYYVTLYTLASDGQTINAPDVDLEEGTVLCIDNNDKNDSISFAARAGDKIDNKGNTPSVIPPNSVLFLVKDVDGWVTAFAGLIPNTLDKMMPGIEAKLTGQLNTIPEIEAALQDRLHTFKEIQTEFANQLHTLSDLERNGFERTTYLYGFLDTTLIPDDASWVINQARIYEPTNIPAQNEGNKYIALAIPIIDEPLVKSVLVNDTEVATTSQYYAEGITPRKILITENTFDTSNSIKIGIELGVESGGGGIQVEDNDTDIGNVNRISFPNGEVEVDSTDVQHAIITPKIKVNQEWGNYPSVTTNQIDLNPPLEVADSSGNATITISPGTYESRHSPSYYASLSDDVSVVGLLESGIRTGVLWFDNVITPEGTYIQIDKASKTIGLQEDNNLDPNVTGGTPYFIYTRIAMRGEALADGYVQFYLRDLATGDFLIDDTGKVLAVKRQYKRGDKLDVLDIAGIKKFKGIEEFQVCVEENFGLDEAITIENRTEGNSCIVIQAIDSKDQTSRGLIQCENDLGKNFEWTSHYIGPNFIDLEYFLTESITETTIQPGQGELSADGWDLNNFTNMKVGVSGGILTLEDDGTNEVGFSFGNVLTAEKTQLLRGKAVNAHIRLSTKFGAGRIYAASWTGTPDAYSREIIINIVGDKPTMGNNWVLDPINVPCNTDATGNQNTYSGSFTVPTDAENYAIFFAPNVLQTPNKFEITELYAEKNPAISGFYLYAPEESGEKYLEEDTRYAEFGLNTRPKIDGKTQSYASLRYTINDTATPMPSGQIIKGKADVTGNWDAIGGAVDYLTFNARGNANISTQYRLYASQIIPDSVDVTFWWAYKQGSDWVKIDESEKTFRVNRDDPPSYVTIPSFEFKANIGDQLRAYASAAINDGAYIASISPDTYLCQTTINFQEFIPGSEDEPINTLYTSDELDNTWEVKTGTDGHIETLELGDLPEETVHHVTRDNFSLNDFNIDSGGAITLKDSPSGGLTDSDFNPDQFVMNETTDKIDIRNTIDGLDLSGFTRVQKHQIIAVKEGVATATVETIPLFLPPGVDFAVLNVHVVQDNNIQEIPNLDYMYDIPGEVLRIGFGNYRGNYQVIVAFYKN